MRKFFKEDDAFDKLAGQAALNFLNILFCL